MTLPDLTGLGLSDLDALLSALRDEASEINTLLSDAATADDADLERLAAIADEVDAVNAAITALSAKAAERAEKAAALSARITPVVMPEVVPEVVEAPAAVVAAVVEAPAAVVAAVVAHPAPRRVVANAPKPVINPDTREVAIVASAGLPGIQGGSRVTMDDLVPAAVGRWESYAGVAYAKDQLFTLKAPARDPRLVVTGQNDQSVMEYAGSEARLKPLATAKPGQTGIVAAGGWCAPAEQRFDICTLAELDGILDVPTISMPRGSISYFRQLDYSTVATAIAAGEFCFTNTQLVALPPVVKPCFEIPCATPVTATLDACGLCLRAGLLQQKAFPELIAAWLHLALIAHAHFLNARNVAQMVAGSAAIVAETATFGAIAPFVDSVLLRSAQYRLLNGMSENAPLRLIAPYWLPSVFEVDNDRRQFNPNEDDDWRADLAAANISIQWIKDYQDAAFLAAAAAGHWPTTVDYMLFAPGAWVRGAQDIISVSTLVDSTLLQTNRTQLLFVETATVMLPWCGPSVQYTVPICPSGATAGPIAATPGTYACSL